MNGKQKGGEFERVICKRLSLWTTAGKSVDVYWRSAMSGGRATVAKGKVRQAGDITAVALEGHALTDCFYIECKFYKNLSLDCLIKGKGPLIDIWAKTKEESEKYKKSPILIFKQNHWPIMCCLTDCGATILRIRQFTLAESTDLDMMFVKLDDMLMVPFPL